MDRPKPPPVVGSPQSLKQVLATTLTVSPQLSQSQGTASSPQLLAHLTAPQTIRASSSAIPFHFPFTVGSLSPVTCAQAVGRLVCSQPVTIAATGFTVVSPSSSIPALQVLGSNAFQGHLASTGMMMLPTFTTGPVKVSSSITTGQSLMAANASEVTCGLPVILQSPHSVSELNFIMTSPASQLPQPALLPENQRSVSGTVHHKGVGGSAGDGATVSKLPVIQSPGKEISFVHIKSQLQQESSFSQAARSKRPRIEGGGGILKGIGMFESSALPPDETSVEMPLAKKIKLEEEDVSDDGEISVYRKLYCVDREKELERRNNTYQDLVTELFFLENGGHFMDYFVWMKRATANGSLIRYLRARKAEDLGEYSGLEKSINNEVKVLTTSGGTLPLVTPVAISKTLPPAITAMQQQQQDIGGIPLSTTAATTTVGSPPPYTAESSSSSTAAVTIVAVTTTTVTMSSALPKSQSVEGIGQPNIGALSCSVTDVYQHRNLLPDVKSALERSVVDLKMNDVSVGMVGSSQEAVIELAKQEAQVMQRISELRKQGLWSLKQLPKVQEYSRNRSHWDYLLEEMQWMAVDFAHERRWKVACAKHIADGVVKQHDRYQQARKFRQRSEDQRLKHLAASVGKMIKDFWSSMIEVALYKRQKDVEIRHRKVIDYVTDDLISSQSLSFMDKGFCGPETSTIRLVGGNNDVSSEIQDLIDEGELPLDDLVQKYAGAYSKEFEDDLKKIQADSPQSSSSSSCSSVGKKSEMESADVEVIAGSVSTGFSESFSDHVKQMIKSASELQPIISSHDQNETKKTQSDLMKLRLRDYQLVGSNWILSMRECGFGCILADEEGLGKKVQVAHYLSSLASDHGNWGPHVIVTQSSALFVWQIIFSRWCPALKLFAYYGNPDERISQRLNWMSAEIGSYHIFITSFKCLTEDAAYFCEQTWNCLIIDETDPFKFSEANDVLTEISSEHRLLLIDSSLLKLPTKQICDAVMLTLSGSFKNEFKEEFSSVLSGNFESGKEEIKMLNDIASVLSLRRLKRDVNGQIPRLEITNVMCPLSKYQRSLYDQLISATGIKDLINVDSIGDRLSASNVLSIVMKLKKLCDHPNLLDPGSLATTMPLLIDGVSFSLPSLLNGALDKDPRNNSDTWSTLTNLVQSAVDSSSGDAKPLSLKEKPLIEELIGDSVREENAMDVDVETMDNNEIINKLKSIADLVTVGSSTCHNSKSLAFVKTETGLPSEDVKPLYDVRSESLLRSMTSELLENNFDFAQWSSAGYLSSTRVSAPEHRSHLTPKADSLINMLSVSSEGSKNFAETEWPKVNCQPNRVITHPSTPTKDDTLLSALVPSLKSLTPDKQVVQPAHLKLANSGKLQLLDILLKQLLCKNHRVVIVSHMSGMLDLLEAYLDECKLLYMRIDARTKVEKHHLMVRRFNTSAKMFCLLICSRTPFLGGFDWPKADAVVLYDVDLSPAMARHSERMLGAMAQASNLTVFKFIAKDTVEETLALDCNILKKGIMSDGKLIYSMQTLSDLFGKSPLVEELSGKSSESVVNITDFPEEIFEMTLNDVEDVEDAKAAIVVKTLNSCLESSAQTEERQMLQRILKSAAYEDPDERDLKISKIEAYAVSFVECQTDMLSENIDGLGDDRDAWLKMSSSLSKKRKSEEDINEDENKENQEELESEEKDRALLFTYPNDRENKQVFVSDVTGEQMPLWMPPTPPHDDSDVYVDHSMFFLYEPSVMSESQLPPVYVKKGHKRLKIENAAIRRVKVLREEQHSAPRSLFERPAAVLRYEREARLMKQGLVKAVKSQFPVPARPVPEPPSDQPDWLIHEDWALLQAYQMHQDLPLSSALSVVSAHSANWELIADVVNACSQTYRSPKQCKNRFENVILPREEGKFLYDTNPRKLKKSSKGLYKTKNNQPMRTNQLYVQDNNRQMTECFTFHFNAVKNLAAKRSSTAPPPSASNFTGGRNTRHIAVLTDFGIDYDKPFLPVHIAALRAERLAKDKKQSTAATAASASDTQPVISAAVNTPLRLATHPTSGAPVVIQTGQPAGQTLLQAGQQVMPGQHIAVAPTAIVSAPLSGQDNRQQQMTIVQAAGQQLQAVANGQSALLATGLHKVAGSTASVVTSVSLPRSLTMTGIVVTQAASLNRPQTVVTSTALLNLPASLNQGVRTIRNVVPLTIRDAATSSINHNTVNINAQDNRSLAQVIATTGLTTTQLVVTQQKQTVGLPQLSTGAVPQHMLNLTSKSQAAANLPALQLQMRQHRAGSAMLQQVRPVQLSAVQAQNPMAALMRKQQAQSKAAVGTSVQGSVNIQQVPRQQLIEGTLQQQAGTAGSTVTQSVTTLLKAVSPAASLSTVTIPVSAVGINVTHPKLLSGKAANSPQQVRQLQVPKRAPTVQFTASKVTALGPMAKSVSSPVILQAQAQQRFLPQTIPARFQQVISSSGTVIAAQIIHQSNAQQTLPTSVTIATAATKTPGTVTIAGTGGLAGVATIPMSSLCPVTNATNANATTTVKVMPTQTMYAKQTKDGGFLGLQKTTMVVSTGLQQVMVRPASTQQQSVAPQLLQGTHITMATSNKTVGSLTPVEKAVQEVVQQAQAQARQVPPITFTATNVTTALAQGTQAQVVSAVPGAQHLLVTSVSSAHTAAGVASSGSSSPVVSDDSQKASATVMKLRNQRS